MHNPLSWALFFVLLSVHSLTHAATITVANSNDSGPGSLRAALASAEPSDTVDLGNLRGTVRLISPLLATVYVKIKGPGADLLTLSGSGTHRLIQLDEGGELSGLALTGGRTSAEDEAGGGAILAGEDSTLLITHCRFSNNGTTGVAGGGAIYGQFVTVSDSVISENFATGSPATRGGGINATILNLRFSTLRDNTATGSGGGAFVGSHLHVDFSTISGNSVTGDGGIGGGLAMDPSFRGVEIHLSTISGNSAGSGGGLFAVNSRGTVDVVTSTIHGNTATGNSIFSGGGIAAGQLFIDRSTITDNSSDAIFAAHLLSVNESIIAQSAGSTACSGLSGPRAISGGSNNLVAVPDGGHGGCGTSTLRGQAATTLAALALAPLADNGGPTPTRALQSGSVAIDSYEDSLCPIDQRQMPGSGICDIGSYEYVAGPDGAPLTLTPRPRESHLTAYSELSTLPANVASQIHGATFVKGFDFTLDGVTTRASIFFPLPPDSGVNAVIKCSAAGFCGPLPSTGSGTTAVISPEGIMLSLVDNDIYDVDPAVGVIHDPLYLVNMPAGSIGLMSGGGGAFGVVMLLIAALLRRNLQRLTVRRATGVRSRWMISRCGHKREGPNRNRFGPDIRPRRD